MLITLISLWNCHFFLHMCVVKSMCTYRNLHLVHRSLVSYLVCLRLSVFLSSHVLTYCGPMPLCISCTWLWSISYTEAFYGNEHCRMTHCTQDTKSWDESCIFVTFDKQTMATLDMFVHASTDQWHTTKLCLSFCLFLSHTHTYTPSLCRSACV